MTKDCILVAFAGNIIDTLKVYNHSLKESILYSTSNKETHRTKNSKISHTSIFKNIAGYTENYYFESPDTLTKN